MVALTCADLLWEGFPYTDQSSEDEPETHDGRVADSLKSDQYTTTAWATLLGE
jgi:hypothetical protein